MKAKKLPSGNWRVQVYAGKDNDGKKKMRSFTAPSKKEAEYLASQFKMDSDQGKDMTVATAIDNYITNRTNTLSPSTIRGYRQLQKTSYDTIGCFKVSKITSEDIQAFINEFSITHSPKTVRNVFGLLSSSIRAIRPNKAINVSLPQKAVPVRHIPNDNDFKRLLDASDGYMKIAILLAGIGTMRRGEIAALNYEDISGTVIHVHSDMVHAQGNLWVIKETPKNSSSDRRIEYPQAVIDIIGTGSGRIITVNPDTISKAFARLRERTGIYTRFHDLRHYAASLMHAIGIPDQYIMERGGWSSDAILKSVYRNTLDDKSKEFSDKMNGYMGRFLE